jgi:hypothetical protein
MQVLHPVAGLATGYWRRHRQLDYLRVIISTLDFAVNEPKCGAVIGVVDCSIAKVCWNLLRGLQKHKVASSNG